MSSPSALPQPQRLALSYAPARARAQTLALFELDARLAAVLRVRREPIAVQLRLAWWRETLERPQTEWPRGEPVLESLRTWDDPSALAGLAGAWEALLAEDLSHAIVAEFVKGRERAFAGLARELGVNRLDRVEQAARIWALADLAANLSDGAERALVVDYGRQLAPLPLPAPLRPLAVLAGLGARSLQQGGVPLLNGFASAFVAVRIGLTGR